MAMERDRAEELGVKTIDDLAAHAPRLNIGGDYEFFGRPEWRSVSEAYGLRFADTRSYDSTLMYGALTAGDVDVISAFSSDGRIAAFDLVVLDDPRQVLPPYDAVLLDAPCSNTGVLAKRVEVRYRLSAKGCVDSQETQLALLCRAADLITEKGFICYSTCSIQADENERLIQRFLKQDRRFRLARESLTLPSAAEPDQDGGYAAILGFV